MLTDIMSALSIGLATWVFAYGMNRVYLHFKAMLS